MKNLIKTISALSLILLLANCDNTAKKDKQQKVDDPTKVELTDAQIENIVKRSYQYVAMYNVNNKFAITQGGWNTINADTKLKDHTMTDIARPNNDSFYTGIMLDLRKEPFIVNLPEFDSKYVSLMVTAYDHYVNVPKSTTKNDFQKNEKILFYSDRTENYNGEAVEGVDDIFEASGDFISVVFRVMPHAAEPEKFEKIAAKIKEFSLVGLSEYKGEAPKERDEITFPQVGATDLDVFENNFVEVMQFVANHSTFDESIEMDREFLASMKLLGVEPGKVYNAETAVNIDGKKFREIADKVRLENLAKLAQPADKEMAPKMFQPKGQTDLSTLLTISITGPIGLPIQEAYYPPVTTTDGAPMNGLNSYVIKMTKEELPPANAFWSLTLYDKTNGFFIPNEHKKYSVGENGGMKLNKDGGIEIYVAPEKPAGVPAENWLPSLKVDEDMDIVLRVYAPQLDKLDDWNAPFAEKL